MTGITKTHRGEVTVGLTIVKDAPYYSIMLGKLFDTKEEGKVEENDEIGRRQKINFANKLNKLKQVGVGGAKRR